MQIPILTGWPLHDEADASKDGLLASRWDEPPSAAGAIDARNVATRREIEDFIEGVYRDRFGATIRCGYPSLMAVCGRDGTLQAALGLRQAADQRLFLEQYLDLPIEALLSARLGVHVHRHQIVEIGSLASRSWRASIRLILATSARLASGRACYGVVTATRELRRNFATFGFAYAGLGPAHAERLPDRGASWGGYFQRDPQILVGAICPAAALLRHRYRQFESLR